MVNPQYSSFGVRRGRWLAGAVLVVGLVLSGIATRYVERNAERVAVTRFGNRADEMVQSLARRMEAYLATIRSTGALFGASQNVTRSEFRHYVKGIDLPSNYPGIQGLGFAKVLAGSPSFEDDRLHGYRLNEPTGEKRSVIVMIEPMDPRNLRALGFDMMSEATRREAMERARDTAEPAGSGKVELVQEIMPGKQAGFLIYVPVYESGRSPHTVEDRRKELVGWVYSPFRAVDLLEGIFGSALPFDLALYAGPVAEGGKLLGRIGGAESPAGGATAVRHLEVAGQPWTLVLRGMPEKDGDSQLPGLVLAGSALITLLLFGITWSLVQGREAAEDASSRLLASEAERSRLLDAERAARQETELARQRAAFLADMSALLASSLAAPDMLEQVARRAIPFVGDGCAIDLWNERHELRREVVVYRDPAVEKFLREVFPGLPLTEKLAPIVVGVAETGEPVLLPEVDPALLDERLPAALREQALRVLCSYVIVPLPSRQGILGTLSFSSEERLHFGPVELALATDLGRRIALAIDNTRLFAGAQEAIRVRDDFLSIASHELRTPLTALQAHLQGLLRALGRGGEEAPSPGQIAVRIDTALRQTRRLGKLVNELLDVSRISAGKLALEREPFDLAELATELAERFREEAQRAGSRLLVEAPPGATGEWDRNRLEQVLTNLLSNATKYGAGQPVELRVLHDDAQVELQVHDRGIGISPDAQPRIFDRFERASSERHYGGLGLGLFISRQIVEAHGGHIAVESEPGQGAKFIVVLPRALPDRDAPV